jgi:hypothetical protein
MTPRQDEAAQPSAPSLPPGQPGMHISPHTLQAMMALQYAQAPTAQPTRRTPLWRKAITWFLVLGVLCGAGIGAYALIVAKRDADERPTAAEIVEQPAAAPAADVVDGAATTIAPDRATTTIAAATTPPGIRASQSPLLGDKAPNAKTSWAQIHVATSDNGQTNINDTVSIEVRTVLDGGSGWYRLSTGSGAHFTVAKYGGQVSVQTADFQWYQTDLNESTVRLMWPFEVSTPTALRDTIPERLREYAYLEEIGTNSDQGFPVTVYRVNFDLVAMSGDAKAHEEYVAFVDSGDPARPYATHELSFDSDGIMRSMTAKTDDDPQKQMMTVTISLMEFGDEPVEFPALTDPKPLPDDLVLPFLTD